MTTLRHRRRRRSGLAHADALYGVLYPANHLRIVDFYGDPEDATRAILLFDRDVAQAPGEIELWVEERKGFNPRIVAPRKASVDFNCLLHVGMEWSFNPVYGSFRGIDGCAEALDASGVLRVAGGSTPAGKTWLSGMGTSSDRTIDFLFSEDVTLDTGYSTGYWCRDVDWNIMAGTSVQQLASNCARVSFPNDIPSPSEGGLIDGFAGIPGKDVLSPVMWKF